LRGTKRDYHLFLRNVKLVVGTAVGGFSMKLIGKVAPSSMGRANGEGAIYEIGDGFDKVK